jgi:hypothetical protein
MKRAFITVSFLVSTALLMIGADFRTPKHEPVAAIKKHCAGYTIIEAGLGLDCNGDTVKLVKKYGYYEIARNNENGDLAVSTGN